MGSSSISSRRSRLRRRRLTSRRLVPEKLEERALLAASVSLNDSNGSLAIHGSSSDDKVWVRTLEDDVTVTVLSQGKTISQSFNASAVTKITFNGRYGDDSFVNDTSIPSDARGGAGNDELSGGSGDDRLLGGSGDDSLSGRGGRDELRGGDDDDTVDGGDGGDRIYGDDGHDKITGSGGDDAILGGRQRDTIDGSAGDDTIRGGPDNDEIHGGEGADRIYGDEGNDRLFGEQDDDFIFALTGNDVLEGGSGDDRLYGHDGRDQLSGGDGDDSLYGGAGHDSLTGANGDDRLRGSSGSDQLDGGMGDDDLAGESGDDLLLGGAGNDELRGASGHDIIIGGTGRDYLSGGNERDVMVGGQNRDVLAGQNHDDILIGGETAYDDNDVALKNIRTLWRSGSSYDHRVELLRSTDAEYPLIVEDTVYDDAVIDRITGDRGGDWYFMTGEFDQRAEDADYVAFLNSLDQIMTRTPTEQLESVVPHASNTVMRKEHFSMLDLVDYRDVTHTAVASGNWSNPKIWQDGNIPSDNANVLIPHGTEVTVDGVVTQRPRTVRVDGTLQFAPTVDTELVVDTLFVNPHSGAFHMGTANQPISSDVTARLLIADNGPIDLEWDPFQFSRGVIVHGKATIYGAEKTPFVSLATPARARTTVLNLSEAPQNWQPGDELVLTGTHRSEKQTEKAIISSVSGRVVRLTRRLRFTHEATREGLSGHVANLTRNAVIESENVRAERGHLMFMHTRDVDVNFAGIYHLGRTDKTKPASDTIVNRQFERRDGTGLNERGRYALHFHRNGVQRQEEVHHHAGALSTDEDHGHESEAARVHGSVVMDSRGWGYVNHSSYVDFTSNVAYDVDGAAFVTEAGDEIGSFVGNLAIHSRGSGEGIGSRTDIQDFGHQGDGFWFQGGGITVRDNVAAGQSGHGFVYFTRGLEQRGLGKARFLADNLVDRSIANGKNDVLVGEVPLREFRNNEAYSNNIGVATRFHKLRDTHEEVSIIENLRVWNNGRGLNIPYTNRTILRNVEVIGTPDNPWGTGISRNNVTRNITFENVTVEGFRYGIQVPRRGETIIASGRLNNIDNIVIQTAVKPNRVVRILDGAQFERPTNTRGITYHSILMQKNFSPMSGSVRHVFYRDTILWQTPEGVRQIYYREQIANYTPFRTPGEFIPEVYAGKTNQELWDQYRKAVAGAIVPEDVERVLGIWGWVGSAQPG